MFRNVHGKCVFSNSRQSYIALFWSFAILTVFEINGAVGARRAHFRGRAHVFRTCAPDVRTFSHSIIIIY